MAGSRRPLGGGQIGNYRSTDGLPSIWNTYIRTTHEVILENVPTVAEPTRYVWISGSDPHNWLRTSGTPPRPPYWDYLTGIYDQYYVPSSSIKVQCLQLNNDGKAGVYLWAMPTSTVAPKNDMVATELLKTPGIKWLHIPGNTYNERSYRKLKLWASTKQITGHPAPSIDPDYHGQFIQNAGTTHTKTHYEPLEGFYWAIGITRDLNTPVSDTFDWNLKIEITWKVMFWRRYMGAGWLQGIHDYGTGADPDGAETASELPGTLGDTDFPTP